MLQLIARSVPVDPIGDPTRVLDGSDPLLWWRDGAGMAGLGRAATLTTSGAHRVAQARRQWRKLVSRAQVHDEVRLPGSGLIALGSFAFADNSAAESILIVPELVIGTRDGIGWATRIVDAAAPDAPALLAPERIRADVRAAAARPACAQSSAVTLQPGLQTRERHLQAVQGALQSIHADALRKVVIARDVIGEVPAGYDPRTTLARLIERYPQCWVFDVDGFFGASPETLVEVHAGHAHARVLAGTRARGVDPADDQAVRDRLLTDAKELAEHAFARDSVTDALAAHVRDLRAARQPFALQLPNVWHLATDVDGTLNDEADVLALVEAAHPTAAVAGVPRAAALAAIDRLEVLDRGRFAGPVGWVDAQGDGQWAVGLRSAQRHGDQITAWAGGGIVAGSVPEREYDETSLKLRPITDALNG